MVTLLDGDVIEVVRAGLVSRSWAVRSIVWGVAKTFGSNVMSWPGNWLARLMAPGKVIPEAVVLVDPEVDSTARVVWNAPISTRVPRSSPRWSVVMPETTVPAPMARLLGSRAIVSVGPP